MPLSPSLWESSICQGCVYFQARIGQSYQLELSGCLPPQKHCSTKRMTTESWTLEWQVIQKIRPAFSLCSTTFYGMFHIRCGQSTSSRIKWSQDFQVSGSSLLHGVKRVLLLLGKPSNFAPSICEKRFRTDGTNLVHLCTFGNPAKNKKQVLSRTCSPFFWVETNLEQWLAKKWCFPDTRSRSFFNCCFGGTQT